MPGNKDLNKAKDAKKDDFYTTRRDIEAELCHYAKHFKDKVVYCNCDDPVTSEFWQFFVRNFKPYGLKKLIATHYEPDDKNYAYSLEICEDTNGDGRIDYLDEPTVKQLPCNGDFRSAACIEILKEADIVVTNPPFSLFREYMAQLMEYGKKFVIIGSLNAVKYRDIFPYMKNNEIWLGQSIHSGDRMFYVPDDYPLNASGCGIDPDTGRKYIRVKGVRWFTNLDVPYRHEMIDLRGNYYIKGKYPVYINFDAIDINKTEEIPCDYAGMMGVPISFLDRYNPDQFELIGMAHGNLGLDMGMSENITDDQAKALRAETKSFRRGDPIFRDDDGILKVPYARIIVRNKNPEPRRYPDED